MSPKKLIFQDLILMCGSFTDLVMKSLRSLFQIHVANMASCEEYLTSDSAVKKCKYRKSNVGKIAVKCAKFLGNFPQSL